MVAGTQTPALSSQVLAAVSTLASVAVPASESAAAGAVGASDRAGSEKVSKWARKKEEMLCYRCGEQGHFIAECTAELCDTCSKRVHASGECPLLREPMPGVTIYDVCCVELMFFGSPSATEIPDVPQSATTRVVKVTKGDLTDAQILHRLNELAPGNHQW